MDKREGIMQRWAEYLGLCLLPASHSLKAGRGVWRVSSTAQHPAVSVPRGHQSGRHPGRGALPRGPAPANPTASAGRRLRSIRITLRIVDPPLKRCARPATGAPA
jgi:hypothetical protein